MNTAVCAAIFALGFVLAAVGGSMDSDGGTPNKASADVVDYETVTNVEAVAGNMAYLPCSMTPPTPNDHVILVIWFKQGQISPVYSYDVRRSSPASSVETVAADGKKSAPINGTHWHDEKTLNGRAIFRVNTDPAILVLKDVSDKDGAEYKCRVDFKKSPTRNSRVNLTVILPPDRLSVLNERGDHIPHYILGPYKEGVTVDITCIASGGRPPPRVTWWQENALIDETFETLPDNKVKNVLRLERLERRHLNTVFTCQASNNHQVPPISSAVTLDMILRPLSIKLIGENRPLSAEIPVNVSCRVTGAKPPPKVTWWKDTVQMIDAKQITSLDGNVTTSVLTFTPTIDDSNKTLSCRSESGKPDNVNNNNRHGQSVDVDSSEGWKINIFHVPVVTLELGSKINGDNIHEGMDVYFECNIVSNPWVYRVTWRHNGKLLNHNPAAGMIISNQTLVLQKVSRSRAGIYTCVGSNQEGDGESHPVTLDVKYAPVCRPGQETVRGVGRREAAKVVCEVEANPSENVQFTWRFNNSRETVDLPRDRYTEEGPRSTAAYTPLTPLDYGTLMCWAKNEYGRQVAPCVYQVIAAGRPDSLENCSVVNQTAASLIVRCEPGFDGGLGQKFVMEVYDRHGQSLAGNVTADKPAFTVGSLPSGLGFDISVYAYNSRGPSDPVQLHAYTLKSAEKHTAAVTPQGFRVSPITAVIAVGCMAAIAAIACIVGVALAVHRNSRDRRRHPGPVTDESKTGGLNGDETCAADGSGRTGGENGGGFGGETDCPPHLRAEAVDDGLDKNPDIIPHDNDYLDEDEKAFERLNCGRLYSSRRIDPEACKQQARGLMPPPPNMTVQQPPCNVYGATAVGFPSASQLLLLHQRYDQQQPMHKHNGGAQQVQFVHVDRLQPYPQHHHAHYQPRGPATTLGRFHGHNHHLQDRSAEIPLLPANQPGLQHQRESTTDLTADHQQQTGSAISPLDQQQQQQQQIIAATRF